MERRMVLLGLMLVPLFSMIGATSSTNITFHSETQSKYALLTEGNETTPEYGGTIRIGVPIYGQILYIARDLIFDSLITLNSTLEVAQDLASSIELLNDNKTYRIAIPESINFHDGYPLNTSDVEFTYQTLKDHPEIFDEHALYQVSKAAIQKISNFTIHNATMMDIHLTQPYAPFIYQGCSAYIIERSIWENEENLTLAYELNNSTVGSGSFKIESIVGDYLTLTANLDYFKGRPYLDKVIYHYIPDTQLPSALKNNEIDLIPFWLLPDKMSEISDIPGLTTQICEDLGFQSLDFNLRESPFNGTLVRRAISHAINRNRIINDVRYSYADLAYSPLPKALAYWHKSDVPKFEYNVTEAERLLDEAGYPRDGTGWRFDITIKVGFWDSTRTKTAYTIEEDLERVGINATVETVNFTQLVDIFVSHDFDCLLLGYGHESPDPDQSVYWHSDSEYASHIGYNNTYIDWLLDKGLNTTERTSRKEIYDEFQEIIASELPRLTLYYEKHLIGYNNDFHNFIEMPGLYHILTDYVMEKVYYEESVSGQGKSPVKLCWSDSQGRKTGSHNGTVFEDIPNSTYIGDQNLVKIRSAFGNYTIELYGTGDGSYSLEIVSIALEYKHVCTAKGTIIQNETKQYNVTINPDGSIAAVISPWPPDVYSDGVMDIVDIVTCALAYGSEAQDNPETPWDETENWNPLTDLDLNEIIDIVDLVKIAIHFGEHV